METVLNRAVGCSFWFILREREEREDLGFLYIAIFMFRFKRWSKEIIQFSLIRFLQFSQGCLKRKPRASPMGLAQATVAFLNRKKP